MGNLFNFVFIFILAFFFTVSFCKNLNTESKIPTTDKSINKETTVESINNKINQTKIPTTDKSINKETTVESVNNKINQTKIPTTDQSINNKINQTKIPTTIDPINHGINQSEIITPTLINVPKNEITVMIFGIKKISIEYTGCGGKYWESKTKIIFLSRPYFFSSHKFSHNLNVTYNFSRNLIFNDIIKKTFIMIMSKHSKNNFMEREKTLSILDLYHPFINKTSQFKNIYAFLDINFTTNGDVITFMNKLSFDPKDKCPINKPKPCKKFYEGKWESCETIIHSKTDSENNNDNFIPIKKKSIFDTKFVKICGMVITIIIMSITGCFVCIVLKKKKQ